MDKRETLQEIITRLNKEAQKNDLPMDAKREGSIMNTLLKNRRVSKK